MMMMTCKNCNFFVDGGETVDCCVYKMKYYHAGMINRANSFSFSEISEASTAYYWYNLDISNALVIYLIFFISLAMMILAFFGNITGLLLDDPKSLVKLPLYEAFSTPLLFYCGDYYIDHCCI